jgi:hypothetical protein
VTVDEIRALTVRPPWSHMIACCGKDVENRGWPTRYRGLLAIHAGANWDSSAEEDLTALAAWRDWSASLPRPNITGPLRKTAIHVHLSAVVAVADLTGCHFALQGDGCAFADDRCSPWAQLHQWHWQLRNVRPLAQPVLCKGKLGLWRLPEDVEKAVREQLEDSHA